VNKDLMNTIEILYERIDEQEGQYMCAIERGDNYATLKSIRTKIVTLKKELRQIEGLLLDEFSGNVNH
jgi:hypothetical protein